MSHSDRSRKGKTDREIKIDNLFKNRSKTKKRFHDFIANYPEANFILTRTAKNESERGRRTRFACDNVNRNPWNDFYNQGVLPPAQPDWSGYMSKKNQEVFKRALIDFLVISEETFYLHWTSCEVRYSHLPDKQPIKILSSLELFKILDYKLKPHTSIWILSCSRTVFANDLDFFYAIILGNRHPSYLVKSS